MLFEYDGERYLRIYLRYNLNKFELFFELKNEFNNLKNLRNIDKVEAYDILSMDTLLGTENYHVFAITSIDGLTITINEIIVPKSMSRANFWSLTE